MGTSHGNDEADFVRRLASGDPQARARLGTHYSDLLRAIARNRAPGRSSAFLDDVVNETLVRVLTAVTGNQIRDRDHFVSFCIGVCERVVHELGRKEGRLVLVEATEEGVDPDNPERAAVRRQELDAAEEALSALPARDRALFEQILLRDEDKDAVCAQFGVTRAHLRVLLHRARERFGEALARRESTRKVS